jgi:Protein of unknown function (DUF3551)
LAKEKVMRKVVFIAAMLAGLPLASLDAHAQYAPWCAYYTKGGTNCGFHSYSQCQAAISGIGGSCSPNPSAAGGRRSRY